MSIFAGGRAIGTECCGARTYTITHQGTFCAVCGAKVYLWNGLLVTEEREAELLERMRATCNPGPWPVPKEWGACEQPAEHGFQPGVTGIRCDEPLHWPETFYEDDEPIEKVREAWERAPKGRTGPPSV